MALTIGLIDGLALAHDLSRATRDCMTIKLRHATPSDPHSSTKRGAFVCKDAVVAPLDALPTVSLRL